MTDTDLLLGKQKVVSDAAATGTFVLFYGGEATTALAASATGEDVRRALEALPSVHSALTECEDMATRWCGT